jgi:biopolymer transport protein TolR
MRRPDHPFSTLPTAQINVTPMIDVMLVLLIIFMIVTPVLTSPVVLPRSAYADARPEEPDQITLGIDRDGAYSLSISTAGAPSGPMAVSREGLGPRLTALYSGRTRDRMLFLKADARLSFGPVQNALAIAQRAGVRVVGTVTDQRARPPR